MALRADVGKLKKLAWETMIREALREVALLKDCDNIVIEAVRGWRLARNPRVDQIDRFMQRYGRDQAPGEYSACAPWVIDPWPSPSQLLANPGNDWLLRMLKLVEHGASGIPPIELKRRMAFQSLMVDRPDSDLMHFVDHGCFPIHTVEQAENVRRFTERFGLR